MTTNSRRRLVIVGGGVAGHRVAYKLRDAAAITLIDPKDYFEIPMAMPRQMSRPGELASLLPFREFLPGVSHVQDRVVAVSDQDVTVSSGEKVKYDNLLLATGSNYQSEFVKAKRGSIADRRDYYAAISDALSKAKSVLIVGGGPIGVEIAGEIVQDHPGKRITLLEKQPTLLPRAHPKLKQWAAEFLRGRGIDVIVDDTLISPTTPDAEIDLIGGEALTAGGKRIAYDVAFWCLGARPDAAFLTHGLPAALNEKGEIRIDPYFRVMGSQTIFAMGDVTDIPFKGAISVHAQLGAVLHNLGLALGGSPASRFKRFGGVKSPNTAIVSLGRNNGLLELPFGQFKAGWMARKMKSRDMLVTHMRHSVGL